MPFVLSVYPIKRQRIVYQGRSTFPSDLWAVYSQDNGVLSIALRHIDPLILLQQLCSIDWLIGEIANLEM